MSRNALLTLLAGTALLLSTAEPARSQSNPPPGVVGGTYDSYGREQGTGNILPNLDRIIKIDRLAFGNLRFTVFDRNLKQVGSTVLIPKCVVSYDYKLASYFQKFETRPTSGLPEQVTVTFRINDPIGDYDFYFRQGNGPFSSEVLKRREQQQR